MWSQEEHLDTLFEHFASYLMQLKTPQDYVCSDLVQIMMQQFYLASPLSLWLCFAAVRQ